MEQLIHSLSSHIKNAKKSNKQISLKSIGWQIDHSLKVINGSSNAFLNSNPENFKPKFNLTRVVLYTLNFIPRGKGKAPKSVVYDGEISSDYLVKSIELTKSNLQKITESQGNYYFEHFLFGHLSKKKYIKFIKLHTKHHLKIIEDILK